MALKNKRPWCILVGPTAVGKSRIAELLALEWNTDIIVADSRQIYQGMDIGTAKPSAEARRRIPRHLIDLVPPDASFSAGMYKKRAEEKIASLEKEEKRILIEGGTGLYLKALLYGLWEGPPADWTLRRDLLAREGGEEGALHRMLAAVDPDSSRKIHPHDLPKIVRALEVYSLTGRPLSGFHEEHGFKEPVTPEFWMLGLRRDRDDLYRRIEGRVGQQVASGLVEETERLLQSGLPVSLPSMRGLGYRQIAPYLKGERTLDEALAILKRDTRRYAKRQLTWFQADPNVEWIDLAENETPEETLRRIKNLKNYKIML